MYMSKTKEEGFRDLEGLLSTEAAQRLPKRFVGREKERWPTTRGE